MKYLPIIFFAVASLLVSCTEHHPWMQPSSAPTSVPPATYSFEQYIQQSQEQIRSALTGRFSDTTTSPYLGDYSLEETLQMRSPFQIEKDDLTCTAENTETGFLLIHGLTDSPFLMRDIAQSLHKQNPCALIRAVLLPGHGTVPGDSITMHHEDWLKTTEFGVRSFDNHPNIQDIYMVGFSTGTALAIRHLGDSEYTNKIKGLLLFSTALKAHTNAAFLAPLVRHIKTWADVAPEKDAARYESFSMNAGAEFYQLVRDLNDEKYTVNIPVFMALSADDTTINAALAGDFFCNKVQSNTKEMVWYTSATSTEQPPPCAGVTAVDNGPLQKEFKGTKYFYGNTSHLAVTIAPSNPHYGVHGKYRNCKSYDNQEYLECQSQDRLSLYGEKNITKDDFTTTPQWKYLRRGTFNPHYHDLETAMAHFIKRTKEQSK